MEAPETIYILHRKADNFLYRNWDEYPFVETEGHEDIKYIRADLAELTWEDMRLAFGCVNEAIDNCEGKTKQEIFEEALRRFNENRRK